MYRRFITRTCRFLRQLAPLALIALTSVQGHAAWVVKSPPGEQVFDFALAPSLSTTLFATTRVDPTVGIWKSIDSGDNWTMQILNNLDYHGVGIKPDDPDTVLAGVRGGPIQISVNGGSNWLITNGSASHDVWRIQFAPNTPLTVYGAGYSNGVPVSGVLQKSLDGGQNWAEFAIAGDADPAIISIAVAPTDANTVYVGAILDGIGDDGLYKTIDGGATWTYLAGLPLTEVDGLAVDPTDADVIYAGSSGSGLIRRSVDGGVSWQVLHDPFSGGVANFTSVRGIAINPSDRRIVYALGGSGATKVIATTNCGDDWVDVDSSGIAFGQPSKAIIDTANSFIYVLENLLTTTIYREALLTVGSGSCTNTVGFPTASGSSAFGYPLLACFGLLAIAAYRRRSGP
ncbi:MAG: hypothetical protein OEO19_20040 [Gammaproteobacteria bacterium]|nr:hypothetical protein [Gammaproteobacteria bacterium]MDH3449261.1 hypothetical protein [Gammaproteobacteria bacterium]